MIRKLSGVVWLLLIGGVGSLWGWTLVGPDGTAQAVVIVPDDPQPVALFAAKELVEHVELATGVRLEIREESVGKGSFDRALFVGETQAGREAGLSVEELPSEGVVLRSGPDQFFIFAHDGEGDPLNQQNHQVGTLWGVYEWLERELGVRWLWPGPLGVVVEPREEVVLGGWDEVVVPHYTRRRLRPMNRRLNPDRLGFSAEVLDEYLEAEALFQRRQRMGRSEDPRPYTGHSFTGWWRRHGEENPEWFQLMPAGREARRAMTSKNLGGRYMPLGNWDEPKRGPGNPEFPYLVAMCVSNPDLHREIVKRWEERRERDPDRVHIIRMGENDYPAFCHCEDCLAWDDPQPTDEEIRAMPRYLQLTYRPFNAGARYARFYQSVHRLASEIDPDVIVTGFIYMNYFVAPEQEIELHPNIVLSFVPWLGWWMPRFPEEQEWVKAQWDGWRGTGATLYYRPNYTLDGYTHPHLYTQQFYDVFTHYHRNGNIGTDFDSLLGQWSIQGPLMYLFHRIHTRPEDTLEELLSEYYEGFGAAAPWVKRYFDLWEEHTMRFADPEDTLTQQFRSGRGINRAGQAHRVYPGALFRRAQGILEEAERMVADSPVHRERVKFLQIGLEHARLTASVGRILSAREDVTEEERREAVQSLYDFRRKHERSFFSNLISMSRFDQSWARHLPE